MKAKEKNVNSINYTVKRCIYRKFNICLVTSYHNMVI